MSMKEIIQDRLSKMEDLNQRRLLKSMMTSLFINLVEYQEEMNQKLEERVFNEIEDRAERHDIYVTLCARDDVDPTHEFLYPMFSEDVNTPTYDIQHAALMLKDGQDIYLSTVFLECEYTKLKALISGGRTFKGEMITANNRYAIKIRVEQSKKYIGEIEQLYHAFVQNGLPWKTVNHPYAYKFFDIFLSECEGALHDEEAIVEVQVDLEEYEAYKRTDVVPLWNIERLELSTSGFPIPAIDKVNFEHTLSLQKTGIEHGYLVQAGEESSIRYIKRTPSELVIVSSSDESTIWNVYKITQPVETKLGAKTDRLVSNQRKSSFVSRFAGHHALTVRAKGEILRMIHSFEESSLLKLEQVEIQNSQDGATQTYEMNPFISDNIRVERNKKVMQLTFRPLADTSFILQDTMSFLVSEIQMYFPEYKCVGVLA